MDTMCNYKTHCVRGIPDLVFSVLKPVFLLLELHDKPQKMGNRWTSACCQHSCIIFQDTVHGPIILSEVLEQVRLKSVLLW